MRAFCVTKPSDSIAATRAVLCRDRPPVRYDQLSINIGSTPQMSEVAGAAEHAVPVKPIDRFDARWRALLERVRNHPGAPASRSSAAAPAGSS